MRIGSNEWNTLAGRFPFLSDILETAFPVQDGTVFEDDVEVEQVGPEEAMYPSSMIFDPSRHTTPSPFERSGERRRVCVCLSDATRVVRTLCLQEYGDAIPWERHASETKIGRSNITVHHRLPGHVFVRSNYDPSTGPEKILWLDELSLAIVTVWMRPVGEGTFARSATIQVATYPEHGFQLYQRA